MTSSSVVPEVAVVVITNSIQVYTSILLGPISTRRPAISTKLHGLLQLPHENEWIRILIT
jgi:hypothetical protein